MCCAVAPPGVLVSPGGLAVPSVLLVLPLVRRLLQEVLAVQRVQRVPPLARRLLQEVPRHL